MIPSKFTRQFLIETPAGEVKLIVLQKIEFQSQEVRKLLTPFAVFRVFPCTQTGIKLWTAFYCKTALQVDGCQLRNSWKKSTY